MKNHTSVNNAFQYRFNKNEIGTVNDAVPKL